MDSRRNRLLAYIADTSLAAIATAGVANSPYTTAFRKIFRQAPPVGDLLYPCIVMFDQGEEPSGDDDQHVGTQREHLNLVLWLGLFLDTEPSTGSNELQNEALADVKRAMRHPSGGVHGGYALHTLYDGCKPMVFEGFAQCDTVARFRIRYDDTWPTSTPDIS